MNDSICYYCTHCGLVSFREIAAKGEDGKCRNCQSELKEYDLKPIEEVNGRGNVNYDNIEKMIYKDYIFNQPEFELHLFTKWANDIRLDRVFNQYKLPIPVECPYCHSKNTSKISASNRIFSGGLLGFGSNKIGKNWRCNTCKSDF